MQASSASVALLSFQMKPGPPTLLPDPCCSRHCTVIAGQAQTSRKAGSVGSMQDWANECTCVIQAVMRGFDEMFRVKGGGAGAT
jgi:hypothetical protein